MSHVMSDEHCELVQGPLENLLEHIDDPFGNNGLTLDTAAKFTPN